MKKKLNGFKSLFADKSKRIRVLFSVVVLVLLAVVLVSSVSAWVETISTVIIKGEGVIDKPIYTNAIVDKGSSTSINLTHFFRKAGNMHFSEASSADGVNFYFPVAASTKTSGLTPYRRNNINDVCVNYLNFTFKVKSNEDADFVFSGEPEITVGGNKISDSAVRMAVTIDGSTSVYSMTKSTDKVVSSIDGATKTATNVLSFKDYSYGNEGKNIVFTLKAGVEKELTISLWLQEGIASGLSGKEISVSNLSLIPASPRYKVEAFAVTDGVNKDSKGGTVKIGNTSGNYASEMVEKNQSVTLEATPKTGYRFMGWYDAETGGSCKATSKTLTISKVTDNLKYYAWFKTEYKVYAYTVYNNAVCNDTTVGSVKAGSTAAGATSQYTALIGEDVTVTATDNKSNYKFIGWYDALTGGTCKSTSTSYTVNDISAETKLYARYVDAYTYTAHAVSDGTNNSSSGGTVNINTNSASTNSSVKLLKDETVTAVAAVKSGYTFEGWYTGTTTSSIKLSADSTINFTAGGKIGTTTVPSKIYAIFTPTYSVTAHAVYNSSVNDDSTGGTVKVSSGTAGATSTAESVKKGSSITVTAAVSDDSKYKFVGWYDSRTGGNQLADADSLSYTFNVTKKTDVYARFEDVANYVIYFDAGHWNKDNAWFAVYAWTDGGSSTTIKMTHVSGNIYKADLGKYYQKVLFYRMDPNKTALDHTSKWNQTADLTVPASNKVYTKNFFTINSGAWDGANGTWSVYK